MRSFKLMLLTTFLSVLFYQNSNGQGACYRVTVVNNQAACQWDVAGYSSVSTKIWGPEKVGPGTWVGPCTSYSDGITLIKLTLDTRCSPIIFSIAGGWAETITQSCTPSCSTPGATIVCTETVSSACSGSPLFCTTVAEITITIN